MHWRDFQKQQRVIEIGDRFVSYIDQGAGEPILLLHGIPTWGYLWHAAIPILAKRHRVIAPDLLGYGFSDKRDGFDRSIARQAEMLERFLDLIGAPRVAIAAHDIGGGVALRLATLFPDRVSRLCLMNTVSYDSWPVEAFLNLGDPGVVKAVEAKTLLRTLTIALRRGFAHDPESQFPGLIEALLAPYATEVGKASLVRNAASLNCNHTLEIDPLLSNITAPTMILWGESDPFQPLKYGDRLSFDIPHAELWEIRNASHFVMIDQPDEVVDRLIVFLHGRDQHLHAVAAERSQQELPGLLDEFGEESEGIEEAEEDAGDLKSRV